MVKSFRTLDGDAVVRNSPASELRDHSLQKEKPEGGAVKVLVAANNPAGVEALIGLLAGWGYDPIVVWSAGEASNVLTSIDGPSLAVLDWMLPDADGTEICQRIRLSRSLRYIYVVVLAEDDESGRVPEVLSGWADDYLRKPYDPRELRARLDSGNRIVARKALRESEKRFESAFEHAGVGMALGDFSGNWLQVNRALCDFLGYEKDELHVVGVRGITHPHDLQKSLDLLQRLLDGTLPIYQMEKRYLHKDGHTLWGLVTVSPAFNAEGRPSYVVAQIQDISERKRAQEALRVAHAESELFINSIPSILIGTDADGQITRWNQAAADTFGIPASAVRGKSLKDCGIRWIAPNTEAEIDSWLRIKKGSRRGDLLFERNGNRHFLGLSINRVTFVNQKNVGLLITGADVTERRHLEEQLRQAQKLEAIGQLAAGIAHEINTPTQYVGDNTTFIKQSWSAIGDLARTAQRLDEEFRANSLSPETEAKLCRCVKDADLDYLLEEIPKAIDQSLEGVHRVAKIVHAMKEFSHPSSAGRRRLTSIAPLKRRSRSLGMNGNMFVK